MTLSERRPDLFNMKHVHQGDLTKIRTPDFTVWSGERMLQPNDSRSERRPDLLNIKIVYQGGLT